MKIALCLAGLAAGKNDIGRNSGGIEYSISHFKEHIMDKYDVDVFAHSWSVDMEERINELFRPKRSIIEKQKTFVKNPKEHSEYDLSCEEEKGKRIMAGESPGLVMKKYKSPKNTYQQCKSMWYSRKKSIELKREYELENNFEYDFVLLARFDLCFFSGFDFENLNNENFYHSNNTDFLVDGERVGYNQALLYKDEKQKHRLTKIYHNNFYRKGFVDFWFLSGTKIMDNFSEIYDNMDKYNRNDSDNGFLPCEKFTSKHLYNMKKSRIFEKTVAIKDRLIDYELVRKWYLNSIH
jgi:hypothetical protein